MHKSLRSLVLLPLLLAACGGGSGGPVAAGRVSGGFGPAGGSLRGPVGTQIAGIEVTIPPGALAGFVELTLVPADVVATPRAAPAGPAFQLLVGPDPGRLQGEVVLRVPVEVPLPRSADDVVILVGSRRPDFDGHPGPLAWSPARPVSGLSRDRRFVEVGVYRFGVYQPILADVPRRLEDAASLTAQGLVELGKGRESSVRLAGSILRQALEADPWSSEARFFEACARLGQLLNDRSDPSPDIDSAGELVEAFGLRLAEQTVLQRLFNNDWPRRTNVPASAPRQAAVLDFFDRVVQPELAAIRTGLLGVGEHLSTLVDTGDLTWISGAKREIDFGEVACLRAAVDGLAGLLEVAASYDLDAGYAALQRDNLTATIEQMLALRPNLGGVRAARMRAAGAAFASALDHVLEGLASIEQETDDQTDDVIVFRPSFDAAERDELFDVLGLLRQSLREEGGASFRQRGQPGQLLVCLRRLFGDGPLDLRALLPALRSYLPVADELPDPTAGGVFPFLSREEAVRRASLPTTAQLVTARIAIDGEVSDWPAASEILLPPDDAGDSRGRLPATDGTRLFLATDGTLLYLRLDLADDDPAYRARYATVYAVRGQDLTRRPDQTGQFELRVDTSEKLPRAELRLPGHDPVPGSVALGPRTFEAGFVVEPLGLGTVPPRDRVLRYRIVALDRDTGASGRDESRPVILRF